jgi:uracil-DNA glycosylase family 4
MRLKGDPGCQLCKLHRMANEVCIMGVGSKSAEVMVVGKMPNSDSYQTALELMLREVGLDPDTMFFTQALKCRNFEQNSSNVDVKTCRTYLEQEIAAVKPKFILALGNEALLALTGHSGIMKYRGRVIDRGDHLVIPTISPSAVNRNPGQRPGLIADLRLFANTVKGLKVAGRLIKRHDIMTMSDLNKLKKVLSKAQLLAYDVETHSEEWRSDGRIVSLSGTCEIVHEGRVQLYGFALPLYHPDSPWRGKWRAVLRHLAPELQAVKKVVAHNGKYDDKWMNTFGVHLITTFDTMLAVHLLNENIQKGLKPTAQARLGVPPWGVDTKTLLTMPLAEVLEYNFLDTYYMYRVYLQLREELKEQPRLLRLFKLLMMPAHEELVYSEMRGIWLDVPRLKDRKPIAQDKLKEIEDAISAYLPARDSDLWPSDSRGRPLSPNYNASNFARWYLFTHLKLPILARGKEKADGSPGDPSMAEGVLLELEEHHPVVRLMLNRVQWQKALSSFFNAYEEIYDEDHRIHTNFKLAGTVTGRLSSGKADQDKISGTRGKVRGVNLQQVPRDPFIRGLFGAPPGWSFVEADYSQIELRIAAFLARERHMLQLYAEGADIHLTTAARVAGIPESRVSKEVRKKLGKPVNFGFLYGMGFKKFMITAFTNYGSVFTEEEARAARTTYFNLFPGLLAWHARQRRLVEANGRVQSPIGRIRHLPDIYSPDPGVRAEAERQAINSPVQGFASDLAVLSMVHINDRLRKRGYAANCLGLVHDAINFEVRNDQVADVLPIIKDTMEDMSIVRKKFGVVLDVPIIADLKVGQHWGDAEEITPDQVYNWRGHSAA